MTKLEETRATELLEAQAKAERLFTEIETRGLIRPAITEKTLNADIYALAKEMYGITTYWHKRIVRAGKNTLLPYAENPPDLMIGTDDILFLDLGPVFEQWEADFGRTFVLGSDPLKHKMKETWDKHLRRASSISTKLPPSPAASSSTTPHHWQSNSDGNLVAASQDI